MALNPNPIVTVDVSLDLAPLTNNFQQTGCMISVGGTTVPVGTTAQVSTYAEGLALIIPPANVATMTWTGGVMTVTMAAAHGIPTTTVLPVFLAGNVGSTPTDTGYFNGLRTATITSTTAFTYPEVSSPGSLVTPGTMQTGAAIEVQAMLNTFYSQGNLISVNILELSYGTTAVTGAAFETWIVANPLTNYIYLVPRYWGITGSYFINTIVPQFENPNSMQYFWVTLSPGNYTSITPIMKDVYATIEDPTVIAAGNGLEFSAAAAFYQALSIRPSSSNRVAPFAFRYNYGVTPYANTNTPSPVTLKAANINYIRTGAEGGLVGTVQFPGCTADGMDFALWWWNIDQVSISINLNLSNAIINGSNNPLAPLYYDQFGINYLQSVLASTMRQMQSYGLVNGAITQTQLDGPILGLAIQNGQFANQCDINAVPFVLYTAENPSDYGNGEYDGLSVLYIPSRGFIHILVNVLATDITTV